jgi:hypothetical protein
MAIPEIDARPAVRAIEDFPVNLTAPGHRGRRFQGC